MKTLLIVLLTVLTTMFFLSGLFSMAMGLLMAMAGHSLAGIFLVAIGAALVASCNLLLEG